MRIITINLAEPHVKALKMLQDLGLYPSRSEAIRVAIRDFLQREFGFGDRVKVLTIPPPEHEKQPDPVEIKKDIARLLRKLYEEHVDVSMACR